MTVYRCAPAVQWVRDSGSILVIDPTRGRTWTLDGAQRTVWSLLAMGYNTAAVVRHLALSLDTSEPDAAQMVSDSLEAWHHDGIVEESPTDGEPRS